MHVPIEPALRWLNAFLRREWPLALPITLAFLAFPPMALALALPRGLMVMPRTMADLQAMGAATPDWLGPLLVAASLVTVVGALTLMALALVPRISVREAILLALRRLWVWLAIALVALGGVVVALIVLGVALGLAGLGQAALAMLMIAAILIAMCFLVLMMPLVVARPGGPATALREGWRLYRGALLKLCGTLCLFWLGVWLVSFAIQVGIGSLLLVAASALGAAETGRTLATMLSTGIAALHWSAFYLFAAALYRAAAGAASSKGI